MLATERAVLIRYERDGIKRWGSGLRVAGCCVLTADHCANGTHHYVVVGGESYPAQVRVRSNDPEVDLAVLEVPTLPEVRAMGCARVNRTVVGRVGCQALGFPSWKISNWRNPLRAQVDGYLPTGEGDDPARHDAPRAPLTFRITDQQIGERRVPKGDLDQPHSPWAGMSGAVVVAAGELVVAVVRGHSPNEGVGSLTLTPVEAINTLPDAKAEAFWDALQVDSSSLPVLPRSGESAGGSARPTETPDPRRPTALLDPSVKYMGLPERENEPFVGRKDELAWLEEIFANYRQDDRTFACVISGRNGIGKTTLVDHFVMQKAAEVSGKVMRVDLHEQDISAFIKYLAEFGALDPKDEIADQTQHLLSQIPRDSILILDNVGRFRGHEVLAAGRWRFFLVVISNARPVSAVMHAFPGRSEHLDLCELDESDCELLFRARLNTEVMQLFDQLDDPFHDLLTTSVQRSPFFVRQVCNVIEEFYFDHDVRDISELIDRTREQISKETSDILDFLFNTLVENPAAQQLILGCSLFSPGKIPLDQLVDVTGLPAADAAVALRRIARLGWISGPEWESGRQWIRMHGIYHAYACQQFESQPPDVQNRFKQAYVGTWFTILKESRNVKDLLGMHEDFVHAIRCLRTIEEPAQLLKSIETLDSEQILALQKVVPPKDRIDFYWTLLQAASSHDKIAGIQAALAESLLRAGNTALAESFGRQSLYWYEQAGDTRSAAAILCCLGTIYRTEGDFARSLEIFEEAQAVYQELGDDMACADIDRQKAQTCLEAGDTRGAVVSLREAEDILQDLIQEGNQDQAVQTCLAYVLSTSAGAYLRLGDLARAEQAALRAKDIHTREVGSDHYYTGYDLRCLAKVRLRQGRLDDATRLLKTASEIYLHFFGLSPTTCVVDLGMAEVQLRAGKAPLAENLARRSLEVYSNSMQKRNKFVAYALRLIAESQLLQGSLDDAEASLSEAWAVIGERHMLDTPHAAEIKLVAGRISLARKQTFQAERQFWEVRSEFLRFGLVARAADVDELIAKTVLSHGIEDWNHSAVGYQKYLDQFPHSLHNLLGQELVGQVADGLRRLPPQERCVLDLYCGAGFVSKELASHRLAGEQVTGVDGSIEMLKLAQLWQGTDAPGDHFFHLIPEECCELSGQRFTTVTCHMGAFQNDVRARHFLFQRLLPNLRQDCTIWLTTFAADFIFPASFEHAYPAINRANPFKATLFAKLDEIGCKPGSLEESLAPTFAKEDYQNLCHFFDFYGFRVIPEHEDQIRVIPVRREWSDRVAFTRLPVISKKVFGRSLPYRYWHQLADDLPGYSDETYGAVFRAERVRVLDRTPSIFSHCDVDFCRGEPIRYAVAAALTDPAGRVLFVRRGAGARDYLGAWSLCSTFADPGVTLEECLRESLQRNLGLEGDAVKDLAPRSIRFSTRSSDTGEPWIMAMCLYEGRLDGEPHLLTPKYSEMAISNGRLFVDKLASGDMGDCIKSYRDLLRCQLAY